MEKERLRVMYCGCRNKAGAELYDCTVEWDNGQCDSHLEADMINERYLREIKEMRKLSYAKEKYCWTVISNLICSFAVNAEQTSQRGGIDLKR